MNIKEALSNPDKTVLTQPLIASIKVVMPLKQITGQYPGTQQSLRIKDESGECWLQVCNKDEVPKTEIGKTYEFSSYLGDKGWHGLAVNEFPAGTKNLKLTKTGNAKLVTDEVKQEEVNEQEPQYEAPRAIKDKVNATIGRSATLPVEEKTNWLEKEKRELRAKAYNTALMTIYPVLAKLTGIKNEEVAKDVSFYAEKAVNFIYEKEEEIQIPF